jgi:hypothetical protein
MRAYLVVRPWDAPGGGKELGEMAEQDEHQQAFDELAAGSEPGTVPPEDLTPQPRQRIAIHELNLPDPNSKRRR